MPERAYPDNPLWRKRFLFFATPALAYLQSRYRFCQPYVRDKSVLDVPCGTGMGAPYLRNARLLVGLDRDQSATTLALHRYGKFYTQVATGNMVELPFLSDSLNVVICLEGLEHLTRTDGIAFLRETARILNSQGLLLLACPLSVDGIHSGNEYHLYEWSYEELRRELAKRFTVVRQKVSDGPAGKVGMIAARKKQDMDIDEQADVDRYASAMSRVADWVNSQWDGSEARYAPGEDPGILPTCFAVLAEELYGHLGRWEQDRRDRVAERICQIQDPVTGLFAPNDIKQEDVLWPGCDLQYIRYQVTYFALSALSALQKKPEYPPKFAEVLLDSRYALGWIEGGPWQDPWNHSNRIMFLLRYLAHLGTEWDYEDAWPCYDAIIRELFRRQDSETGLWHGFAGCEVRKAVYAAYHFFPFMLWRGICPPHVDRIIDSTLSIQHADGLFGAKMGGGACEDLDAIDILVKFSLISDHRSDEVRSALLRAFDRLLQIQKPDGGFPNHLVQRHTKSWKRRVGEMVGIDVLLGKRATGPKMSYYSGWQIVKVPVGESDMWAAWFRPLALSLIASRYPEIGTLPTNVEFHKMPGLGWHDADAIINAGRSVGNY